MFTVVWHYEGEGLGRFPQATFTAYDSAVNAFRSTTADIPLGQPVPISALLIGATGYVIDYWTSIEDSSLIEH